MVITPDCALREPAPQGELNPRLGVHDLPGRMHLLEMAKAYRMSRVTRLINSLFRGLTRFGLGASYRHVLTVPGRKTGRLYSTPVDVLELDGQRWLVAGYGPANWVANARAAGEVTLSRGSRSQQYGVEEAATTAAVSVLRRYITEIRVTRPYFDAGPLSPDDEIAAELPKHPVFHLVPR